MKQRSSQLIQILISLLVLIGLGWLGYTLIIRSVTAILNLQSDLAIAIIAAAASVIVSVISVLVSKYQEQRQAIIQEIRAKKIPVYEKLIQLLFKILFAEKLGQKKPSEREITEFIAGFTQELIVWGADDVIRVFQQFRTAGQTNADPMQLMFLYEDLLLAIRKDLGHANSRLKKGTLLSLFINDIQNYIKPRKN